MKNKLNIYEKIGVGIVLAIVIGVLLLIFSLFQMTFEGKDICRQAGHIDMNDINCDYVLCEYITYENGLYQMRQAAYIPHNSSAIMCQIFS